MILLIVFTWGVWTFNRLIRTRNQVKEAWAGIDVQLQRRYDLVPNLVKTVKGYTRHESGVLERVTQLRGDPEMKISDRADLESGLSRSIGRLFALAEDYPDLKASEGFQQLHASLVEIEEHLQFARRYYNGSVRDNNNLVEGFPSMIIARALGFATAAFFEIELASQRAAPKIELGVT
ncbi:MAG: LemA family protein [Xanthomonadales bacterium]|nr:LemA family protein [Gammaproteobacteria bacterium]NND57361.1 LemA family protein [Xanthomonadales bacterium]NNK50643.1 LemA family protein [Xanthomonadales bacterium]